MDAGLRACSARSSSSMAKSWQGRWVSALARAGRVGGQVIGVVPAGRRTWFLSLLLMIVDGFAGWMSGVWRSVSGLSDREEEEEEEELM